MTKVCRIYKILENRFLHILYNKIAEYSENYKKIRKKKNKWREYKNILDNLGRFCYDLYIKEEKNQKKGKEEIPVGTVESQFKFNMNQNCIFHTVHL